MEKNYVMFVNYQYKLFWRYICFINMFCYNRFFMIYRYYRHFKIIVVTREMGVASYQLLFKTSVLLKVCKEFYFNI